MCVCVHVCRINSGSNSGSGGMTSSISLLDDSLLCVPSPGKSLQMCEWGHKMDTLSKLTQFTSQKRF